MERWGKCKTCGGEGELLEINHLTKKQELIPCGACGGEGFSGNPFESPSWKAYERDVQSQDEDILRGFGK